MAQRNQLPIRDALVSVEVDGQTAEQVCPTHSQHSPPQDLSLVEADPINLSPVRRGTMPIDADHLATDRRRLVAHQRDDQPVHHNVPSMGGSSPGANKRKQQV